MDITTEELTSIYKNIGKVPEAFVRDLLIRKGVTGDYLKLNPLPAYPAYYVLNMNFPRQSEIVTELFEEVIRITKAEEAAKPHWVYDASDMYKTKDHTPERLMNDWFSMWNEVEEFTKKVSKGRTNNWIVRWMSPYKNPKAGVTIIKAPTPLHVWQQISLVNDDYQSEKISIWKRTEDSHHLYIRTSYNELEHEEVFFFSKPTLREVNELRSKSIASSKKEKK